MTPAEDCYCVFVTVPNLPTARKIAALALKGKLAACANLLPKIESHYWWMGKLEFSSEAMVLFKTTGKRLAALESCVLEAHPYETPEFIAFKIDSGNAKYLDWIKESVKRD
jgi:periplasmic divalent cation tolerance protein